MRTVRVLGTMLLCAFVLALCLSQTQASAGHAQVYFLSRATAEPVCELRHTSLTPQGLIAELLRGPVDGGNLYSPLSSDTQLLGVKHEGRTVVLDFNEGFLVSTLGPQDKYVEEVLRLTLSQIASLDSFRVTVHGRPVPPGSHVNFGECLDLRMSVGVDKPSPAPQGEPVPHLYALIDPGHGGIDPGAYNWEVPGSVLEKDVVLDIATHVYDWVDGRSDATANMTRYDDSSVDGDERVTMANDLYQAGQCDIFVSVHSNSQSDAQGNQLHTAKGIETYYKKTIDESLAADVHSKAKGAYFGSTLGYFVNRSTKYGNLQVLRETVMPACLVEAGFISNTAHDYQVLSNATHREEIAYHIYLGIRYYWWGY